MSSKLIIPTLALGIGLSTAVFTVANAVLIKRLPVQDQEQLVVLNGATADGRFSNFPLSTAEFTQFAEQSKATQQAAHFAYYGAGELTIRDGATTHRLRRAMVSGNFFDVLGARAVLGRPLHIEDDRLGAPAMVVLSHRAWTQRFGGDSAILGRTLVIHETGQSVTVAGVMAPGLDYPGRADFWAPLTRTSAGTSDSLHVTSPMLNIVARLAPGASPAQARNELTSFFRRDGAPALEKNVNGVAVLLPDLVLGDTKPAVLALSGAAALLLILACINVANLLLVRGLGRAREVAIRTALGASRGRIVRELFIESAKLSVVASLFGAAVAYGAVALFKRIAPAGLPRLGEVSADWTMLLIASVTGTIALTVSAVGPAIVASRADPADALRSGGHRSSGTKGVRRAAEWLVVTQVAFATLVLATAGLTVRSLVRLQQVDLAYEPRQLLVAEFAVRQGPLSNTAAQNLLMERLAGRVRALPDVESATPALNPPFAPPGYGIAGRLQTPEQHADQVAGNPILNFEIVAPEYFTTLGVPIVRGRAFNTADVKGAPAVAIVSLATADYFWPNGDALGKTIGGRPGSGMAFIVVGIATDTRYRELRSAQPAIYFPLAQSAFPVPPSVLLVRARGREADLVPAIRRVAQEVSPDLTVATALPFETLLDGPQAQPRMIATLLSTFAATALFLAAVGLFSVIAEQLRRRRREFGIRAAIGATPRDIAGIILGRGVAIAGIGAAAGIAASLGLGRLMSALLFEVEPNDPATLLGVGVLLMVVAAVACAVPARSAARTDPTRALRAEG